MRINKKLRQLENNVVNDNITDVDCFIDLTSIPEAEKVLHRTAYNISKCAYEEVTIEAAHW